MAASFDLHVLSTPPAFILSQDQTLMFKCLIPFKITLGYFSVSFTVWISVLYEPSFQTLIKCFAFNLTHKRISRICICSLKNFACFILFSYQCSSVLLISCLHQQLLYIITCCFICQQLFSTFFRLIFALSTKALKIRRFFSCSLLPCSATLDNIHPIYDKSQQHFSFF